MMAIDEINDLLPTDLSSPSLDHSNINVIEDWIDQMSTRTCYLILLTLSLGNAADAVEISCVGFVLASIPFYISQQQKEFLTSAVFIGMLIGGVITGYLSDRIGRRSCLLFSLAINFVAGLLSAVAINVYWLIIFRVIAGFGIGGSVPVCFSLGAELFPNKIRGKLLSIVASFWMVGSIFTALVGWLFLGNNLSGNKIITFTIIEDWRCFTLVCALPVLLALVMTYLYIPESPRYLISIGKYQEMSESLYKLTNIRIEQNTIDILTKNHNLKNDNKFGSLNDGNSSMNNGKQQQSTLLLLLGPGLFISTIVYSSIWFSLSFGSYGLGTWISVLFEQIGLSNPFADTFIFAAANLPGNLVSIFFVEKFGRKKLLTLGMILSAVSAIGFGWGSQNSLIVVLCAALFNAFSTTGWNSLDCMSVEGFPTSVRTSAMGLLAASGRLGSISAQFVFGSLEQNIPLLLFITSACMAAGGLLSLLLPPDKTGSILSENVVDNLYNQTKSSGSYINISDVENIFDLEEKNIII